MTNRRFDKEQSENLKEAGMSLAALKRAILLEETRTAVIRIALERPDRTATADDAMKWLVEQGKDPAELGPAAGSIFRGSWWRFSGRWAKSIRVSNHRSDLRIWEYLGGLPSGKKLAILREKFDDHDDHKQLSMF